MQKQPYGKSPQTLEFTAAAWRLKALFTISISWTCSSLASFEKSEEENRIIETFFSFPLLSAHEFCIDALSTSKSRVGNLLSVHLLC